MNDYGVFIYPTIQINGLSYSWHSQEIKHPLMKVAKKHKLTPSIFLSKYFNNLVACRQAIYNNLYKHSYTTFCGYFTTLKAFDCWKQSHENLSVKFYNILKAALDNYDASFAKLADDNIIFATDLWAAIHKGGVPSDNFINEVGHVIGESLPSKKFLYYNVFCCYNVLPCLYQGSLIDKNSHPDCWKGYCQFWRELYDAFVQRVNDDIGFFLNLKVVNSSSLNKLKNNLQLLSCMNFLRDDGINDMLDDIMRDVSTHPLSDVLCNNLSCAIINLRDVIVRQVDIFKKELV